jgi:hypothetical protein
LIEEGISGSLGMKIIKKGISSEERRQRRLIVKRSADNLILFS